MLDELSTLTFYQFKCDGKDELTELGEVAVDEPTAVMVLAEVTAVEAAAAAATFRNKVARSNFCSMLPNKFDAVAVAVEASIFSELFNFNSRQFKFQKLKRIFAQASVMDNST